MPVDRTALAKSLDALAHDVEHDPALSFQAIVESVSALFAPTGAGIILRSDDDGLRYVAASDPSSRLLEECQEELGIGPCVDSVLLDTVVECADLRDDPRWPGLALAVGDGIRAVLGAPLHIAGAAVGSLNVTWNVPHTWDPSERDAIVAFTPVIERVMLDALAHRAQSALAAQLQTALDKRVLIDRAVGYVMAHHQVDAITAFNALRRAARAERVVITDVARRVLAGDALRHATAPGADGGREPGAASPP